MGARMVGDGRVGRKIRLRLGSGLEGMTLRSEVGGILCRYEHDGIEAAREGDGGWAEC
jgi:hypothetical protein